MCEECQKYSKAGAMYCLVCGSPVEVLEKKAEDKKDTPPKEEGMFKHASLDLDLD